MADLRECPFCGGEAIILKYPHCDRKYVVVCKNNLCGASIGNYSASKENAIRAWNTRKPMEAVVAELEKLPQYRWGVTMLTAEDYVKVADVLEIVRNGGKE